MQASAADQLPDPYHVLVSEAMLQQTQVATVVPYFQRFITRWPTVADLAATDEQAVLREWQGLGYYSRARNLLAAARVITSQFGGQVPQRVDDLLSLPGVGRYTAGAIASIAYNQPAPIVDGNVIRVISRLDRLEADPRTDKRAMEHLWERAEAILPRQDCADFNSALMELGALICVPRQPACLTCPVRAHCAAAEAGVQGQIPAPRKARPTPLHHRWIFCIHHAGRYLVEQRPAKGRWAGMWQFVTCPAPTRDATGRSVPTVAQANRLLKLRIASPTLLGHVTHALTHRRYAFAVFHCQLVHPVAETDERRWLSLRELTHHPLPRPHLKVMQMLEALERPAAMAQRSPAAPA